MRRLLGWLLILGGACALGLALWTLLGALFSGGDSWIATGLWWFRFHPDSLQLLQPAIERHVSVWLYEAIVQPLLEAPLVLVAGGTALVLLVLGLLLRRA